MRQRIYTCWKVINLWNYSGIVSWWIICPKRRWSVVNDSWSINLFSSWLFCFHFLFHYYFPPELRSMQQRVWSDYNVLSPTAVFVNDSVFLLLFISTSIVWRASLALFFCFCFLDAHSLFYCATLYYAWIVCVWYTWGKCTRNQWWTKFLDISTRVTLVIAQNTYSVTTRGRRVFKIWLECKNSKILASECAQNCLISHISFKGIKTFFVTIFKR